MWIEREPLYLKFNGLFRLSEQQDNLVGDMRIWNEASWSWDFKWIRPLHSGEEAYVNQLSISIDMVQLQLNGEDVWE